jgi:hypothetical protein
VVALRALLAPPLAVQVALPAAASRALAEQALPLA